VRGAVRGLDLCGYMEGALESAERAVDQLSSILALGRSA
jgi:hypothetical protein